jgi:hypothetical protein
MSLANNTHFSAEAVPFFAPDGREVVIVIVKATFAKVGSRAVRADKQMPVRLTEVPHVPAESGFHANGPFQPAEPSADAPSAGRPGVRKGPEKGPPFEVSVKYPADLCVAKEGCDVVVVGDAVSRTPTRAMEVAVAVGPLRAALRVHGERVYDRAFGKLSFGPAATFERRPLVWELAYGGTSDDFSLVERRNPVGRGVAVGELAGLPAPCIEDPARPLVAGEASAPMGFGAIATSWLGRTEHAGTFDEAWLAERMPLAPLDASPRAYNVAAPALVFPGPPKAGTPIALVGMAPEGAWSFELPSLVLTARGKTKDGRVLTASPTLDTLLLEPSKDRIELTARAVLPRGRGKTLLAEVMLDEG